MTAIPARSVEAFLRKPDPAAAIVLVYGADPGLVSERARRIVGASVDDPEDPFQTVRLDGDALASDPARLVDEAFTVPLFGGRRAVWVRAGSRNLAPAVEPLLANPPRECRVVIEGGDWKKTSPLLGLLEKARGAAVLACPLDDDAALAELVADEVAAAGLAIEEDARERLIDLLGGNRLASRGEVRKLALYAHGAGTVTLADVEAVVGDASVLEQTDILDAAFGGATAELDALLTKAWSGATNASVLAGAALRHAMLLHRLRVDVDRGRSAASVVQTAGWQVGRNRHAGVARQLDALPLDRLERIVADLAATVLDARRQAGIGEALVSRALMRVALAATPRRR